MHSPSTHLVFGPQKKLETHATTLTQNEASDSSSDSDSGDDEEDPRGILITGVDDERETEYARPEPPP